MNKTWGSLSALALGALLTAACSTHNTTLVQDGRAGQVIYQITEEQAFTTVLAAYAEVLPKQSVDDISSGTRRGYESTWRWGVDTYSQKVLVIPAVGSDAGGREVRGYWFDVSGSGSSGSGRSKNLDLYRRLREAFDAIRDRGRRHRSHGRPLRDRRPRVPGRRSRRPRDSRATFAASARGSRGPTA